MSVSGRVIYLFAVLGFWVLRQLSRVVAIAVVLFLNDQDFPGIVTLFIVLCWGAVGPNYTLLSPLGPIFGSAIRGRLIR